MESLTYRIYMDFSGFSRACEEGENGQAWSWAILAKPARGMWL